MSDKVKRINKRKLKLDQLRRTFNIPRVRKIVKMNPNRKIHKPLQLTPSPLEPRAQLNPIITDDSARSAIKKIYWHTSKDCSPDDTSADASYSDDSGKVVSVRIHKVEIDHEFRHIMTPIPERPTPTPTPTPPPGTGAPKRPTTLAFAPPTYAIPSPLPTPSFIVRQSSLGESTDSELDFTKSPSSSSSGDSKKGPTLPSSRKSPRHSPKPLVPAPSAPSPDTSPRTSKRKVPDKSLVKSLGDLKASDPGPSNQEPLSSSSGSSDDPSPDSSGSSLPEKPDDFELIKDPFKVCSISNFFADKDFADDVRHYLEKEAEDLYEDRESDIFKYMQFEGDSFEKHPLIEQVKNALLHDFGKFCSHLFNESLRADTMVISASRYDNFHHLLCHDDIQGYRKVAFIIYLSKNWKREYGGTLDLFNSTYYSQPDQIAASLVPEFNKIVFFAINPRTHHQVAEVVTGSLDDPPHRITINGWFYGVTKIVEAAQFIEPQLQLIDAGRYDNQNPWPLEEIIRSIYLNASYQMRVQAEFLERHRRSLYSFLKKRPYDILVEEFERCKGWQPVGPPNRRKYDLLTESNIPERARPIIYGLASEAMFLTMFNYTGRKLHKGLVASEEAEGDPMSSSAAGPSSGASSSINLVKHMKTGIFKGNLPVLGTGKPTVRCSSSRSSSMSPERSPRTTKVRGRRSSRSPQARKSSSPYRDPSPSDNAPRGLGESGKGLSTCSITSIEDPEPKVTCMIRRWRHGYYTTAADEHERCMPMHGVVDCHLTIGVPDVSWSGGGHLNYIDRNTGNVFYKCLLLNNTLRMAWLTPSVYRYISYHNNLYKNSEYYDINLIFSEK